MSPSPEAVPPVDFVFDDVGALVAEAPGWDGDFFQLQSGAFRGHLQQVRTRRLEVSRVRFDRRIRQQGTHPDGALTFALVREAPECLKWRSRRPPPAAVLHFQPGTEIDVVSAAGFDALIFTMPREGFEDTARAWDLPGYDRTLAAADLRQVPEEAFRQLRATGEAICSGHAAPEAAQIGRHLLAALHAGRADGRPPSSRLRDRALLRCEEYLRAHPDQSVTVRQLSQASGASERTLLYAYRERFGVGPKEYLHARRLGQVRTELRLADPSMTRVADVANRWDFWHMGQFAADYRRLFAERPSETLARPRA